MDLNIAVTSNVWLLSPAGWYATIELQERGKAHTRTKQPLVWMERHLHEATEANINPEKPGRQIPHCNSFGIAAFPPYPRAFGIPFAPDQLSAVQPPLLGTALHLLALDIREHQTKAHLLHDLLQMHLLK